MPPATPIDPHLGIALKQLRETAGLTQEALAGEAGLTAGTLSKTETGETSPTWNTIVQLTKALNISFVELATTIEAVRQLDHP